MWKHYCQAAMDKGQEHYNIIGIRWGQGGSNKHVYTGIKAARVVESLHKSHGLDVSTLHGIGFSFGGHVISAMASEIVFSKLGKIARLSLLDPGRIVNLFEVDGKYKSVDRKQLGFVNKNFANFVDVYHSSTTGIYDEKVANPSVGHVDIWINGGANGKTMSTKETWPVNSHKSSVYFFGSSIVNWATVECEYYAARCPNPNWKPFSLQKWKKAENCGEDKYGRDRHIVGQYINGQYSTPGTPGWTQTIPDGDYLVFINSLFDYCYNLECTAWDTCFYEALPMH